MSLPAAALHITLALGILLTMGSTSRADGQVVSQEVERRCQPAEWPKDLPSLDALLDSTALAIALDDLPRDEPIGIIFSILYRDGGPPPPSGCSSLSLHRPSPCRPCSRSSATASVP